MYFPKYKQYRNDSIILIVKQIQCLVTGQLIKNLQLNDKQFADKEKENETSSLVYLSVLGAIFSVNSREGVKSIARQTLDKQ